MNRLLPIVALCLAGCATEPPAPPLLKTTTSGLPEGTFHNTTVPALQQKLAAHCLSLGRAVEDVNPMQLTCVSEFSQGERDRLAVTKTGGMDLHPQIATQWTMLPTGSDVHVTARAWLQSQGLGGLSKEPLTSNDVLNKMQSSLNSMGAE